MPTPEQFLSTLNTIAGQWDLLATAWYLYFTFLCAALGFGIRPSKRTSAVLLVLPLLPVSAVAWFSTNPIDGTLTGLAAIALLLIASHLPQERIHIEPSWRVSMGILLIVAGWLYPPLLQTDPLIPYFYAAPAGLIPCPTLLLITGLSLMMGGLESRSWSLVLGGIGLYYGIFGVVRLGIPMDFFLIVGALLSILVVYLPKATTPQQRLSTKTS